MRQKFHIPFEFKPNHTLTRCAFPRRTATNIHVKYHAEVQKLEIHQICLQFVNCTSITIDFKALKDHRETKNIIKAVLKKWLRLDVVNTVKSGKIVAYINKTTTKYRDRHANYNEKQMLPVLNRKHSDEDFVVIKAPKNPDLRRRFLLEHLLDLSNSPSSTSNDSECAERKFSNISHLSYYRQPEGKLMFFTCGIEEAMSEIQRYIDCVVDFGSFSILVTSFDIFYHNHKYDDDCTQPLSEIYFFPTAKVTRKTYTNKTFTEISITIGHYEFLVVGGYISMQGSITPFLGSSIGKFKLSKQTSTRITVPALCSSSVRTFCLLNQYMKRTSNKLWGLHSQRSYTM